jgi:hypothetical protein
MSIKKVLTYKDNDCIEYDLFNNDEKIGYYVKYNAHPVELTVLDNPVFELYYDYNEEFEEFTSSYIFDNESEFNDFLESELV